MGPADTLTLPSLIRARELGTGCHFHESSSEAYSASAAAIVKAWWGWRGRDPSECQPPPAGDSVAGPIKQEHPDALPTLQYRQRPFGDGDRLAADGNLRQRMRRQRDLALQPLGSVADCRSKAVICAALEGRPVLDILSGKRLAWDGASAGSGVAYECVDGAFATAELAGSAGAARPGSERMWAGACPPSGSMWKRIRMVV